jgi:hypothetical protein
VLAVSDNYRRAPWCDWLYSCDFRWWKVHNEATKHHASRWTIDVDAAREFDLVLMGQDKKPGLSTDPTILRTGANSGYQAINLAAHFAPKRIVLIGYDMQATGGMQHWFGDHPRDCGDGQSNYEYFREGFRQLAIDLQAAGIEVINATRVSALTVFRRATLEDVFS